MRLWTLHSPDFNLTSGRVDHSKSDYYNTVAGVVEAYKELWRRLETPDGQIVWCYTDNTDMAKTGIEKVRWELEVPDDNILCFLDSLVWNRILDHKPKTGLWWDELFVKKPGDGTNAIIRHQVLDSDVIDKKKWQCN